MEPANEGHGFTRAINSGCETASAAVRFSRPKSSLSRPSSSSTRLVGKKPLRTANWAVWGFLLTAEPGVEPASEGHGFTRAINSRCGTASAAEVRFSRPGVCGALEGQTEKPPLRKGD